MTLQVALARIHSDSHGDPGGSDFHSVVLSWVGPIRPALNQIHLGGLLGDWACVPTCTEWILNAFDFYLASDLTLEQFEHTSAPAGTDFAMAMAALKYYRNIDTHSLGGIPQGAAPWVMNPAFNVGWIPPSGFAPYAAADAGYCVVVDTPLPGVSPPPQPVTSEEYEAMQVAMWDPVKAPWQGNQVWAWVDGKGDLHERWAWPGQPSGEATLATGCEPNADVGLLIDQGRRTVHLNVKMADGSVLHLFESGGDPWGRDQFS